MRIKSIRNVIDYVIGYDGYGNHVENQERGRIRSAIQELDNRCSVFWITAHEIKIEGTVLDTETIQRIIDNT